jgi:hypothetical protein
LIQARGTCKEQVHVASAMHDVPVTRSEMRGAGSMWLDRLACGNRVT